MKQSKYFKNLFIFAAIWNIVAGLSCWIGTTFMSETFFTLFDMPKAESLFAFHAFFWTIIVIGYGFGIVSRDLNKNHGIVTIGIFGKIAFLVICLVTFLMKEANFLLLGTGIIDLIFAGLFLDFLRKYKN